MAIINVEPPMTLSPTVRLRLFAVGGGVLAVWLAIDVAYQEFFWPAVVAVALLALIVGRLQPLPLGTVILGAAAVGYIVGNRGFAQLSLAGRLPLLPAEAALLVGGGLLLVQSAWRRELPFARDALGLAVFAWLVIGAGRVAFDVRTFGFMAVRDFATVYYAAFYFLAQEAMRSREGGTFLRACVLAATLVVLVAYPFYERFPAFFVTYFAIGNVPVILYKGDLVGTMLATSAVIFFVRYEEHGRVRALIASFALIGGTLATNSRASLLGLLVATIWLALGRRWRFARAQLVAGLVAVVAILTVAYAANIPWARTPLYPLYERVLSIADASGQRTYLNEEAYSKGDNNVFRTVWWGVVIDETLAENPYVGLGFGRDLAARFVQEYYPDSTAEFSTRSPHNILVTILGRMGALGLLAFGIIVALMALRTYRAVRARYDDTAGWWCGGWVILVSACFGVVLEGPMGAVIFWTVLGMANRPPRPEVTDATSLDRHAPHLPRSAPARELTPSS